MNLFSMDDAGKRDSPTETTRRIKAWVHQSLDLPADVVVHVAELKCHEPDCPDFETVITLMSPDASPNRTVKLSKPLTEVTESDIAHASFLPVQDCQH